MAQFNTIALQSEKTRVQVKTTAGSGDWQNLLGAASVSVSGGDAASRSVRDLSDAEITLIGRPGNPAVSIPINLYNPHIKVHRELKNAKDAGTNIEVRWFTEEDVLQSYTGNFSISDTGVVTFTGTDVPDVTSDFFATGLVLREGSNNYLVDSYTDANTISVVNSDFSAITTAVTESTGGFSVVKPSVMRPGFVGRIINMDVEDIGEQSQMSTTLDIQPETALPDWELVITT